MVKEIGKLKGFALIEDLQNIFHAYPEEKFCILFIFLASTFFGKIENKVEKEGNKSTGSQYFLIFQHCFQNAFPQTS